MLRRLLNAFDWSMAQRNKGIRYVQGMNVLAAPFLYVCGGEAECMAFGLFEKFITIECPVYVRPTLEGVHRGLKVRRPSFITKCTSCLISACTELSQNCTAIYVSKISKQSYTPSHVYSILSCHANSSCPHILGLYSTSLRSPTVMGLPPRLWNTHEYPRNYIPTHHSS